MSARFASATRKSLALAVALLIAGAASLPAQDSAHARDSSLVAAALADRNVGSLRPGDVLRVVVFREKELSGEFTIDAQGYVQIPGIGVVMVGGLTPVQVTGKLREQLVTKGFTDPDIAVQPMVRISVLGEVAKPSLYPVEPGTNLIQLLTIAGGPTPRADLKHTRVVRDGRSFNVDLEAALAGSAGGLVVLNSHDYVVVPPKSGFNRETFAFVASTATVFIALANLFVALRR